jgi:hypothetical protein
MGDEMNLRLLGKSIALSAIVYGMLATCLILASEDRGWNRIEWLFRTVVFMPAWFGVATPIVYASFALRRSVAPRACLRACVQIAVVPLLLFGALVILLSS